MPQAIWELQPALVVTTNYDSVLQWAKPGARRLLNHQTAELADLFAAYHPTEPAIWHLHGHMEEADSLILGPTQYATLYEQHPDLLTRYRAALEQLRHAAANHTFLFVGFGLRDPYVVGLLKEVFAIFQGSSRPHFALLKDGEADTRQLWETCNVQVIPFPDFGPPQVELLQELAASRRSSNAGSAAILASATRPSPPPLVPDTYRAWLARECSGVELLGLQDQQGRAVQL